MTDILSTLFESANVKDFVKNFKECESHYGEPLAFLEALAEWLPLRVYERYYGDDAPHAVFGAACAASLLPVVSEDRKWWPAAQQAWHAARQRLRAPWPADGQPVDSGSAESRWERFQTAAAAGDFASAYGLARGFLGKEEERVLFQRGIIGATLRDGSSDGLKLILLAESFRFAELLNHKHAERILFPALHHFVEAASDDSLKDAAEGWAGSELARRDGHLGRDQQEEFERAVLFGDSDAGALQALDGAAAAGAGIDGAWEALQIAALQSLANSKPGPWQTAARAAAFAALTHQTTAAWEAKDRLPALRSATVQVRRASTSTRESGKNRDLREVARVLLPIDTVNTLKSVVSHSDPVASATAAVALLAMDEPKPRELCETLASLAAKNDGHMGRGYDLLMVQTAARAHSNFASPEKDRMLVCCAHFLGRLKKSYELFGAYGVK